MTTSTDGHEASPLHDGRRTSAARGGAAPVVVPGGGARVGVVVPAGGTSRRFGSDKLLADLGGRPLLAVTVRGVRAALPGAPVVVVGPPERERLLHGHVAEVRVVREEPPGAGPAAAVLAGARALTDHDPWPEVVVVVPGDAPWAGGAVPDLVAAVGAGADAAVGVAPDGSRQHLLLAVRTGHLAGLDGAALVGSPARLLLSGLPGDRVAEVPVDARASLDVDDPAALARAVTAHRSRRHPPRTSPRSGRG